MSSLFTGDFGNDLNGLNFQDGTTEQDASLTELLDEIFNNHDQCPGDEAATQKNMVNTSKAQGQSLMLQNTPLGHSNVQDNQSYIDVQAKMDHLQVVVTSLKMLDDLMLTLNLNLFCGSLF